MDISSANLFMHVNGLSSTIHEISGSLYVYNKQVTAP